MLTPSSHTTELSNEGPSKTASADAGLLSGAPGGSGPPPSRVSHVMDSHTFSHCEGALAELNAPGSGTRLFQWLITHFPCRLFVDDKRRHCISPQQLFRVHPSPIVALLQQQQLLVRQRRGLLQSRCQKDTDPRGDYREQRICFSLVQQLKEWAPCNSAHSQGISSTEESIAADVCNDRRDEGPPSGICSGGNAGLRCICEAMEGLRGAAWISSANDSMAGAGGTQLSCSLDEFVCPCEPSCAAADLRAIPLPLLFASSSLPVPLSLALSLARYSLQYRRTQTTPTNTKHNQ